MSNNIRATTMKDGSIFHTLMVGETMHILGQVRRAEDAKRCRRVNIMVSKSPSASR